MKRIRIDKYTFPNPKSVMTVDKCYRVDLGNGYHVTYPSEKETLAFLAQTNRELTLKMYELNFLFSEVLKMYRTAWPYFDLGRKNIANNLQGSIKFKIEGIENSFNLLVDRANWENGNFTVFSHFYSIIDTLKEICGDLSKMYCTKNHPVLMYEADSLLTRLDHIYTSIVIYPQKIELVKENRQIKAVLKVV
jgi:hypothetical protein